MFEVLPCSAVRHPAYFGGKTCLLLIRRTLPESFPPHQASMFFISLLVSLSLLLEVARANICYYNVSVIAGTPGVSGSALARLNGPAGVAVTEGGIFVADALNSRIVNVSFGGEVRAFAGSGTRMYNGVGPFPKSTANLVGPQGLAWDSVSKQLFFTDSSWTPNCYGDSRYGGLVSFVRLISGSDLKTIGAGPLQDSCFIGTCGCKGSPPANPCGGEFCKHVGHSEGQLFTATFNVPNGLTLDPNKNIFIADTNNHCIRHVTTSTPYPTNQVPQAGWCTKPGFSNGQGTSSQFNSPFDITFSGSVYWITDTSNHCIRIMVLSPTYASVYTVGGNKIPGSNDGVGPAGSDASAVGPGQFYSPRGITYYDGKAYVADSGNKVCLPPTLLYTVFLSTFPHQVPPSPPSYSLLQAIRVITPSLQTFSLSTTYSVDTLIPGGVGQYQAAAGSGLLAFSFTFLDFSNDGTLFVSDASSHSILRISGISTLQCDSLCPEGYYCPSNPSTTLSDSSWICPASYYCPRGSTSPTPCVGSNHSLLAQSSISACVQCPAGYVSMGTSKCTACSAGKYTSSDQSTCVSGFPFTLSRAFFSFSHV